MTDTPAHMDSFAAPELVLDRVREAGLDAVVEHGGRPTEPAMAVETCAWRPH